MRRTLVVSNAAYRPYLARALEALGLAHYEAERRSEAVNAFEEAVAVLRQFAKWETAGMHDLAVALGLLARSRARAGRDGDAAVSQEESVSILRTIVRAGARELRPWLAHVKAGFSAAALGPLRSSCPRSPRRPPRPPRRFRAPTSGAHRPRSAGTSLWESTPRGPPPPLRRGPGEHGGSSWSRWPGCRASGFSSVRAPRRSEGCRPDVTPAHRGGEAAYEMDLQLGRVDSASFGSLRLLSNQCARSLEDLVEHRSGEPTGERVLLARMV